MNLKELLIKEMTTNLVRLAKQELELELFPEIELVDSLPDDNASFGLFDPNQNKITIVSHHRHPMDVMRTLVHELVHWKQTTVGQDLDGADGSYSENQANAIAGMIMRKFGRLYPEYFSSNIILD